jgi:hypothetical protein
MVDGGISRLITEDTADTEGSTEEKSKKRLGIRMKLTIMLLLV